MDYLESEALDMDIIRGGLRGVAGGWRLEVVSVVDSTNARVLQRAAVGEPAGLVLFAEEQRAGRGRRGRVWLAPPGQCLLLSVLLRPGLPSGDWGRLALAAAVATARAVEETYGLKPELKWPNDVLLDDRKLAGILIESTHPSGGLRQGAVVIGIGVNVHVRAFPPELEDIATSLTLAGVRPDSRNSLAACLLNHLGECSDQVASDAGFAGLCAAFGRRDALEGHVVVAVLGNGELVEGRAVGLSASGALRLIGEDGQSLLLHDAHTIRRIGKKEDSG